MKTKTHFIKTLHLVFALLFISACGGGGGGGGGGSASSSYSISTNTSAVAFEAEVGSSSTSQQNKTLTVTFKGDGVVAGYAPGISEPNWLNVNTVSSSNTTATFELSLNYNENTPEGLYQTELRFVTGKTDGSVVKYKDVDVTFDLKYGVRVTQSHLFSLSSSSSPSELISDIEISDSQHSSNLTETYSWELVSSNANWLSLSNTSGTTSASLPQLSIDKDLLLAEVSDGLHNTELVISTTSNNEDRIEHIINVSVFLEMEPILVTDSIADQLDFIVTDAAYSSSADNIYIADKEANRVYVINATSGETTGYFVFSEGPKALASSPNGQYIFIALSTFDDNGVAIIDTTSNTVVNQFTVDIYSGDIEGSDNGSVFLAPAFDQWSEIQHYDLSGNLMASALAYQGTRLSLAEDQESTYAITVAVSPSNISHFTMSGNSLTEATSPYHGTYNMGYRLWVDIENDLILTEMGHLFNTLSMTHQNEVVVTSGLPIRNIAFDHVNNKVYFLEKDRNWEEADGVISSVDLPAYNNYQVIEGTVIAPLHIFSVGNEILSIGMQDTNYQITRIIKP